jgi:hypothetical protein
MARPASLLADRLQASHLPSMNFSRLIWLVRWLALLLVWHTFSDPALAAGPSNVAAAGDVAGPARIAGTLYEIGSNRHKILYYFVRTAHRNGSTVQVQRQFTAPDGTVAATETVLYQSNRLVAYEMKEFQANLSGSIRIERDPAKNGQSSILIGYAKSLVPTTGDPQALKPDTLIDDDLYPFMLVHWDELMRGDSVKFRFVSIEWQKTFNFRLVKTGESVVGGHPCAIIEMKPNGFLLSQMVNPLVFTIEKAAPHMMLSYIGRTTPRVKKGDGWKYLDAETVFDLASMVPAK